LNGLSEFLDGPGGEGEFTKGLFIALTAILTVSKTINGVKKALGMEVDKQAIAELKILEAKKREAEIELKALDDIKAKHEQINKEEEDKHKKDLEELDEKIKKQEELLELEKKAKIKEMKQEDAFAYSQGEYNEDGGDMSVDMHTDEEYAQVEAGNTGGPVAAELAELQKLREERIQAHGEKMTQLQEEQGQELPEERYAAARQAAADAEKNFSDACAASNHPLIARNKLLIKELEVQNAKLKAEYASAKTIKDTVKREQELLKISNKIKANETRIGKIQKKNQKIASGTQSVFSAMGNTLSTSIQSGLQGIFNKLGPIGNLLSQGLTSLIN
jgi:hypothetical protein